MHTDPTGQVAVHIPDGDPAREPIAELLGEGHIERELRRLEVTDGGAVDVREQDTAQVEIPHGSADGAAFVAKTLIPRQVGQAHVRHQVPQPRAVAHTELPVILSKSEFGGVPVDGVRIRGNSHTGITHASSPGIGGDQQEWHCRGDGVELVVALLS